jgi:hypothetical protein
MLNAAERIVLAATGGRVTDTFREVVAEIPKERLMEYMSTPIPRDGPRWDGLHCTWLHFMFSCAPVPFVEYLLTAAEFPKHLQDMKYYCRRNPPALALANVPVFHGRRDLLVALVEKFHCPLNLSGFKVALMRQNLHMVHFFLRNADLNRIELLEAAIGRPQFGSGTLATIYNAEWTWIRKRHFRMALQFDNHVALDALGPMFALDMSNSAFLLESVSARATEILLKWKADPNEDTTPSALQHAIRRSDHGMVVTLVSAKASVDRIDMKEIQCPAILGTIMSRRPGRIDPAMLDQHFEDRSAFVGLTGSADEGTRMVSLIARYMEDLPDGKPWKAQIRTMLMCLDRIGRRVKKASFATEWFSRRFMLSNLIPLIWSPPEQLVAAHRKHDFSLACSDIIQSRKKQQLLWNLERTPLKYAGLRHAGGEP